MLAADETPEPEASKTAYLVHQDDELQDSGLAPVAFLDDRSDSITFGGEANAFKPTNKTPAFALDRSHNMPVTQLQVDNFNWFKGRIDENAMRVVSDRERQQEVIERIRETEIEINEKNARSEKWQAQLTRGMKELNGMLDRMQREMMD